MPYEMDEDEAMEREREDREFLEEQHELQALAQYEG